MFFAWQKGERQPQRHEGIHANGWLIKKSETTLMNSWSKQYTLVLQIPFQEVLRPQK